MQPSPSSTEPLLDDASSTPLSIRYGSQHRILAESDISGPGRTEYQTRHRDNMWVPTNMFFHSDLSAVQMRAAGHA
jgi:hypothetical protein